MNNENKEVSSLTVNEQAEEKPTKKKNSIKRHIPFYILEVILLCIAIMGLYIVSNATRMEKIILDKNRILVNAGIGSQDAASEEDSLTDGDLEDDSSKENSAEDENTRAEVADDSEKEAQSTPQPQVTPDIDKDALISELKEKYGDTFNLAFFGVDSREGELGAQTRSDSMIICSVNMNTHEVKLVSIYRDTYLNLGNGKYNKCNAAYANGGPEQALSMINMNTDLYLTEYVTVGFAGLIEAIDALGGVPIDVTEEEIFHLNNYQMKMAEELGLEYTPVVFSGMQMLNGLQATAYCRIRYTAGDDFKRAERQRTVIAAMLQRAGNVSFGSLTSAITAVLPNVQTSLGVSDLINMASLVSDYKVTVSDGFPFEGMRNGGNIGTKGSCVVPTSLTDNVKKLHKLLYDEENYKPSSAVRQYSEKIKEDTAEYLIY